MKSKNSGFILLNSLLFLILFISVLNLKITVLTDSLNLRKLHDKIKQQLLFENYVISNFSFEESDVYSMTDNRCQATVIEFQNEIKVDYYCFEVYQVNYSFNEYHELMTIDVYN